MSQFSTYQKRYIFPLWGWYLSGIFVLAVVNLVTLEIPQLAKEVINNLESLKTGGATKAADIALFIIALGFLLIIVRTLSRLLMFWPSRKAEAASKQDYFDKVINLPAEFFEKHGMGDLISRLANDIGHVRIFYGFGILQVLNVAFLLVFTITKMASVHAILTALCLMPLVLMFVITRTSIGKMHFYSKANQAATGQLTNRVTEAFVNVHVLQANAATEAFARRIDKENQEVYDTNIRLIFLRTVIFPLMTCLAGLSQLVILFYGGSEVIAGRLSIGDILAFNVYIGLLTFPLTAIGIILSVHQRAKTALERLGEIDQGTPRSFIPEVTTHFATTDVRLKSYLSVRNLTFSFNAQARPAVSGISFELKPGRHVGLFGPIGSGKSTLMNLIVRYYDPPRGSVSLNGSDIVDIDPRVLRSHIGYALQSVHLFSNSIRENLQFGLGYEPSLEDLTAAASAAQILHEIESFPDGWETQIGEKGIRLSGGQKQRLALARVFLRKAPLILLDDVLSAVDHATEKAIIAYINKLGCSMLIASHRGSALKHCHEILVLNQDGELVDRGRYEDLLPRHPGLSH